MGYEKSTTSIWLENGFFIQLTPKMLVNFSEIGDSEFRNDKFLLTFRCLHSIACSNVSGSTRTALWVGPGIFNFHLKLNLWINLRDWPLKSLSWRLQSMINRAHVLVHGSPYARESSFHPPPLAYRPLTDHRRPREEPLLVDAPVCLLEWSLIFTIKSNIIKCRTILMNICYEFYNV